MHRHVGFVGSVHAQHAKMLLVRRRIGTKPHQGQRDRNAGGAGEFRQKLARLFAGIDHTAAAIQDRFFGRCQHFKGLFDLTTVAFDHRVIGPVLNL